MSTFRYEEPVLIVGGGPAGLSASVMLSDFGIDHLLVERHPGLGIAPKAHIISPRTLEIYGQHGFAEDVYTDGSPRENNATVRWFTSLAGDRPWDRQNFFTVDSWAGGGLADYYSALTPYLHGNWQQNRLEPGVRKHAEQRNPGKLLFNHELVELSQDDDGVTATIRDRGADETYTVRSQYLIGADGGKVVGPSVGIPMLGAPPFVAAYSLHFKADLSSYLDDDDCVIRLFARPEPGGPISMCGLLAMGPTWDRHAVDWALHVILPMDEAWHPGKGTKEQDLAAIREQIGIPDLEAEIVGTSDWLIEATVAERYSEGRVFIAGDACHRHSPMGGLGLNTAIQDVHNLTWKLAEVLKDKADPALLDTYSAERQPVGLRNMVFSTGCFYRHLSAAIAGFTAIPGAPAEYTEATLTALFSDTPDGANRRQALKEFFQPIRYEFQCADIELGYFYGDGGALVPDGSEAPPSDPTGHLTVQTTRPGHRLPHAVIDDGSGPRSTHTLLPTGGFLVLAGPEGRGWVDAAREIAERRGITVAAHTIGDGGDIADPSGTWEALRGHGADGAILVRPDGHVAYRAADAGADPQRALEQAFDAVLGAVKV
jgi:2,4-dichlorophenol 6-monooxygenase